MRKVRIVQFLLIIILTCHTLLGIGQTITIRPSWIAFDEYASEKGDLNCSNCSYSKDEFHYPYFQKVIEGNCQFTITNEHYSKCSVTENALIALWDLDFKTTINSQAANASGKSYTIFTIIPFRKSADVGYEKLDSLSLKIQKTNNLSSRKASSSTSNSVLSNGDWIKVSIAENGIYKVDFNFLQKSGLISNGINVNEIKLYGNGGGMLPLSNNDFRYDDLQENAIQIFDIDNNGIFNNGDYFLFYGTEQNTWKWNSTDKKFTHKKNLFSDSTFYFITINNNGVGKRIQDNPSLTGTPATRTVNQFIDCAFHEKDEYNFIKSGRNWYGDAFDVDINQTFDFNFPNLQPGTVKLTSSVISRTSTNTFTSSKFSINYNGSTILNQSISNVGTNYTDDFARGSTLSTSFVANNDNISLNYIYTPYNSSSTGWIDFIELNAIRRLINANSNMLFRDVDTINQNAITQYSINNITGEKIWDVTDVTNVSNQQYDLNNSTATFHSNTQLNSVKSYFIFNDNYKTPSFVGNINTTKRFFNCYQCRIPFRSRAISKF
ncbi:MAG: hypothetical protein RLZZ94_688 [Bacteroidota bacterium]